MKKLLLIIFITQLVFCYDAYSDLKKKYNTSAALEDRGDGTPKFGDGYLTVEIYCFPDDRCELSCFDPGGPVTCDFATAEWCENCDSFRIFYQNSKGDEMFDHAKEQINLGIFSGVYTNNIMYVPLGKMYYRTVEWSTDIQNFEAQINITITEKD